MPPYPSTGVSNDDELDISLKRSSSFLLCSLEQQTATKKSSVEGNPIKIFQKKKIQAESKTTTNDGYDIVLLSPARGTQTQSHTELAWMTLKMASFGSHNIEWLCSNSNWIEINSPSWNTEFGAERVFSIPHNYFSTKTEFIRFDDALFIN